MDLFEKMKNLIKGKDATTKTSNPNEEKYKFISDECKLRRAQQLEYLTWYRASSTELDLYYKGEMMGGFAAEPFANKNNRQYFWALSQEETQGMKKLHSGVPRAAITTLVNTLQDVQITSTDVNIQKSIDAILEANNFNALLNQESRPLTLTEGDGAWKVVFNKNVCDYPLNQFYEGQDVEFAYISGILVGICYKDYYKYQGKNYVLLETRYVKDGNSYIKYELFLLGKKDDVKCVPLNTIPELANLPKDGYEMKGLNILLGVKSQFFHNTVDKERGLSVLAGKLDIADDMDMLLSVESMTEQNSGPVEYYPVDLLKRNKHGKPVLPKVFGRKYVKKPSVPNADGVEDGKIDTSAPDLNFEKYTNALIAKTQLFLSGILSPATMGIDISKKDNAEAQREKEKVTINTRNNIIANEAAQLKQLIKIDLMLYEYMQKGVITIKDYDISVNYNDFASPSFETMANILTPMLSAGAISKEMFVDKLYGNKLSEEQKQHEIAAIEEAQNKDNFNLGDLYGTTGNMEESRGTQEEITEPQE